ncbi:N-6 DNA methylase [Planktothrix rubescens]|uniref:N-6 DNA methylase n=1 Tax=Planktothrix rubescens TaxID=59512 RepID=UPI0004182F69|nr:N-6 DNA methylase [Planktothrix rubescens]
MGRHQKTIASDRVADRREIGYYSTPKFIASFLAQKLLEIRPQGKYVIDPCVGKGELLSDFLNSDKHLTCVDIVNFGFSEAHSFFHQNFIDLYKEVQSPSLFGNLSIDFSIFDYWIANPPYNCHEVDYIKKNKEDLKQLFYDVGVHNMYSMFISAIIDLASEGAVIGLIILDSFLTSKAHTKLRKKILEKTTIHYLLLCPTDLFWSQKADVRTCILILQKGKQYQNEVKVCNRPRSTKDFQKILSEEVFHFKNSRDIFLSHSDKDNFEFLLDVPEEIKNLFVDLPRLSERFNCITGISTGNDKKYLSDTRKPGFSVPFYKNPGTRKFFTLPNSYLCDNFLDVGKQVKNFIVRNTNFLYQPGIICSSMGVEFSACYLPTNATCGVNANIICKDDDVWWLLAYLNSKLVSYLVRGILIRTNMITSGYVARIPIPEFDEATKIKLSDVSKNVYHKVKLNNRCSIHEEIDLITRISLDYLNISKSTHDLIYSFCADIIRMT